MEEMIEIDETGVRIQKLMNSEGLNAARFSQITGIQTATLSHIFSGRNKASLDQLKKIASTFKRINREWLIFGDGDMYRSELKSHEPSLFDNIDEISSKSIDLEVNSTPNFSSMLSSIQQKVASPAVAPPTMEQLQSPVPIQTATIAPPTPTVDSIPTSPSRAIKKIIVYFTDNTFEEFDTK